MNRNSQHGSKVAEMRFLWRWEVGGRDSVWGPVGSMWGPGRVIVDDLGYHEMVPLGQELAHFFFFKEPEVNSSSFAGHVVSVTDSEFHLAMQNQP